MATTRKLGDLADIHIRSLHQYRMEYEIHDAEACRILFSAVDRRDQVLTGTRKGHVAHRGYAPGRRRPGTAVEIVRPGKGAFRHDGRGQVDVHVDPGR